MDAITAILRAAHCKSTHHYFAIDALFEVSSDRGQSLANFMLANYGEYLKETKDPDTVFKDFENHVLHVQDGYWGGAAKMAEKWLDKSLRMLSVANWKEAAYAIGVLSHYFTDPFMPLHTAQSPRETIVHRPLEWSVCCSYQFIFKTAMTNPDLDSFALDSGSNWLTDGILRGATMANRYYEPLIDDYDLKESSRHPELALGSGSKSNLAIVFTWVLTGWGSIIDRIANESTASFPKCSLVLPTLLAGVQTPMKKIVAAIDSAEQRKEVERILDEYQRTGNVVRNVSPEQRVVRKVRKECPQLRPNPIAVQKAVASTSAMPPVKAAAKRILTTPLAPAAVLVAKKLPEPIPMLILKKAAQPSRPNPNLASPTPVQKESKPSRERLTVDSQIVDAPAIGPQTAVRFEAIGLKTVHDLLTHNAEWLARELETKWITAHLVSQWQDQARLACQIERLSAAGAGLLVMSGIRSAEELARRKPSEALAILHATAETPEGKRLLRDHEPPPLKTVQRWIESAGVSVRAA